LPFTPLVANSPKITLPDGLINIFTASKKHIHMHLFKSLLIIHIAAGTIAFIVAPVAMIVKKGGTNHRRWGKVFFWSMTVVAATAAIMAPMHENMFLTLVAVFSFYLAFSGFRAVYRKKTYHTGRAAALDWIFALLNGVFSFTLIVFGILKLPNSFGIISIVFGFLGTSLSVRDIFTFIKPSKVKSKWFFDHMTGMIAAYIAAMSAFSAVNFNFEWLPTTIQWLWPTIIGVPLMNIWIRSYRKKFNKGTKAKELVEVRIQPEEA
jgi:hypothetical protein